MMVWLKFEPQLPWEDLPENKTRLRLVLGVLAILATLFAFWVANTSLPPKDKFSAKPIPEHLVKLVLEQKKKKVVPPPPPPKIEKPKEERPKKTPEKPIKPSEPPKKAEPKPKLGNREQARLEAQKQLAVFDALADLREEAPINKIRQSKPTTSAEQTARTVERSLITNAARQGSGGINTAKASRSLGGGTLKGGGSTKVTSNLAARKAQMAQQRSDGKAQRPAENIERVMDANKAAIYALYRRALRKNPTLRGEVIFRIRILPSGKVANVTIVSSDLNDKALERKLMARIRLINFGAMDVEVWEDNYRMTFLPS